MRARSVKVLKTYKEVVDKAIDDLEAASDHFREAARKLRKCAELSRQAAERMRSLPDEDTAWLEGVAYNMFWDSVELESSVDWRLAVLELLLAFFSPEAMSAHGMAGGGAACRPLNGPSPSGPEGRQRGEAEGGEKRW
jgi:hypothetical protein